MDGYLTKPFINNLSSNLKASWMPGKNAFSDFYKSIAKGAMKVAVSDENFMKVIESLNEVEPELAKALLSLESGGKIQSVNIDATIPSELNISGIRKSIRRSISGGVKVPTDIIFHDFFDNLEARGKISAVLKKPLFLEIDLVDGKIEYLFRERSFNFDIGDAFSWARFVSGYALPFQRIRILEPYLYKNVTDVDLSGLLKTLTKNSHNPIIEIISRGKESEIIKIKDELESIENLNADIRLYNQLSDVSSLFHKRVVWTDYWVLLAERGFDFLKPKKEHRRGLGEVKLENNLFLTGKYASKKSIWHQVNKNWEEYITKADLITT